MIQQAHPDKAIIHKDTCIPTFVAALFTIGKARQPLKCAPTDARVKMWYNTYSDITQP